MNRRIIALAAKWICFVAVALDDIGKCCTYLTIRTRSKLHFLIYLTAFDCTDENLRLFQLNFRHYMVLLEYDEGLP
jgi:hypothetical protein